MVFSVVDPSTVGQYTGLEDKNGKKIFEGDVGWLTRPCILSHVEIKYLKGGFFAKDIDGDTFYPLHNMKIDGFEIEIIGNIHDNHTYTERE